MNRSLGAGPKAIVFDLDGTLIDSAPDLQAAINRMLAQLGRSPLSVDAVTGMIGDGVPKLIERALTATGGIPDDGTADALAGWVARFGDDYEGCGFPLTRPFAGVIEVLAELHAAGFPLAICTNKPQVATVEILKRLGLARFFNAVLGGDALNGVRKPDPRPLLAAIEALGVAPGEAVMVGDHLNDLACARGAGTPAILCAYGYSRVPVDEMGADAVIERFTDLPAAISAIATLA